MKKIFFAGLVVCLWHGALAAVVYEEAFYVDGTVRQEGQGVDGTVVGSDTNGLGVGAYTWSVTQTQDLLAKYTCPGPPGTGDGCLYYSSVEGASSYASVNFNQFEDYGSLTLTAKMNALDCSPMRMGFCANASGSFVAETNDAVYIEVEGGDTLGANGYVALIVRHDGVRTTLKVFGEADILSVNDDRMTLIYDRDQNSVRVEFTDGSTEVTTNSGPYMLAFDPEFSCVKYEIRNEGYYTNSNFPRWAETTLYGTPSQPEVSMPVYCGFYRGNAEGMSNGCLYVFTNLANAVEGAVQAGNLLFPVSGWECVGYGGDKWYMYGQDGLYDYEVVSANQQLDLIGGFNYSAWHGIASYNGVFYGLYGGTRKAGPGLYCFIDPEDPLNTGIRLFGSQSFPADTWTDLAFDGVNFFFVHEGATGTNGIYKYHSDDNTFELIEGTETYLQDWDGLAIYDDGIAAQSSNSLYILLLGGQSNAEGWGYQQYLEVTTNGLAVPRPDVDMFYFTTPGGDVLPQNTIMALQSGTGRQEIREEQVYPFASTNDLINRFGPELGFASRVRDQISDPNCKVAIIKSAYSGSSLYGTNDWLPDGTAARVNDARLYCLFQETVWKGLAALQTKYPYHQPEILGMGWVQGESDALETNGAYYAQNLELFIEDLRATFGSTNLPFVLSTLSSNQIEGTKSIVKQEQWPLVITAQYEVAGSDEFVGAISTEGYETYDATNGEFILHFTSSSLLQIGEDLADKLLEISGLNAD